jgi:hypothetical protein
VRARIIQPRTGISCHGRMVWRGAPCSPQRTWAENDVFECFYSIPELFSLGTVAFAHGKSVSKGLTSLRENQALQLQPRRDDLKVLKLSLRIRH